MGRSLYQMRRPNRTTVGLKGLHFDGVVAHLI